MDGKTSEAFFQPSHGEAEAPSGRGVPEELRPLQQYTRKRTASSSSLAAGGHKKMLKGGPASKELMNSIYDFARKLSEHLDIKDAMRKLWHKETYAYETLTHLAAFVARGHKFEGQKRAKEYLRQASSRRPYFSEHCPTRQIYGKTGGLDFDNSSFDCTCQTCKGALAQMRLAFKLVIEKITQAESSKRKSVTLDAEVLEALRQYLQPSTSSLSQCLKESGPDMDVDLQRSPRRKGSLAAIAQSNISSGTCTNRLERASSEAHVPSSAGQVASGAVTTSAFGSEVKHDRSVPASAAREQNEPDVMDCTEPDLNGTTIDVMDTESDEHAPRRPSHSRHEHSGRRSEMPSNCPHEGLLRRRRTTSDTSASRAGSLAPQHLQRRQFCQTSFKPVPRRPTLLLDKEAKEDVIDATASHDTGSRRKSTMLSKQADLARRISRAPARAGTDCKHDVALLIKQRWCDKIFDSTKVWEIRGTALTKRGRVCIAQSKSRTLVGEVTFVDCLKVGRRLDDGSLVPWSESEADRDNFIGNPANAASHCIEDLSCVQYPRVFAWVMDNRQRYAEPLPYKHKVGCITWVKLDRADCRTTTTATLSGPQGACHSGAAQKLQPPRASRSEKKKLPRPGVFASCQELDKIPCDAPPRPGGFQRLQRSASALSLIDDDDSGGEKA
mmetsp:Transcript_73027/g.171223  ORF Transcript_73027/g.171223 Transcript_73027/m.171223 type:complete len:668 (-) Transcript_73027:103-2106(-)